jgi:hypothetical protein
VKSVDTKGKDVSVHAQQLRSHKKFIGDVKYGKTDGGYSKMAHILSYCSKFWWEQKAGLTSYFAILVVYLRTVSTVSTVNMTYTNNARARCTRMGSIRAPASYCTLRRPMRPLCGPAQVVLTQNRPKCVELYSLTQILRSVIFPNSSTQNKRFCVRVISQLRFSDDAKCLWLRSCDGAKCRHARRPSELKCTPTERVEMPPSAEAPSHKRVKMHAQPSELKCTHGRGATSELKWVRVSGELKWARPTRRPAGGRQWIMKTQDRTRVKITLS